MHHTSKTHPHTVHTNTHPITKHTTYTQGSTEERPASGIPDLHTVFSQVHVVHMRACAFHESVTAHHLHPSTHTNQAQNNQLRRLEDSLNADFPVDSQDDKGNTLLIIGAQNGNRKLIDQVM